ncbi:MAG: hypothetical protein KatS3mg129_2406 [Leptospiraceae bacterium]|nr:MAG: hypothetical protein KatS3mg129_2406 [Leptospiraceae bacterium]
MNSIFKKSYICAIFLAFLIFLTDKIFLIPAIKKISLYYKKVEIFFYESRYNLFQYLQESETQNNNKFALILGSSRSGMFSQKDFQNELPYSIKVWNFSAPLAGTSYYYYWLDKALNSINKKPAFVLLELDAINLGNPSIRISLPYSYDPFFMLYHMDFYRDIPESIPYNKLNQYIKIILKESFNGFNADEVDSYFIKYFFIISRYNIHPLKIWENFKTINYFDENQKKYIKIPLYEFAYRKKIENLEKFKSTYGGIPVEFYTQIPEKDLKIDAQKNFLRFLPTPELSSTQIIFLKKILEKTSYYQIPLIIYKPPMTDYANQILKDYKLYYLSYLIEILNQYKNIYYIDASFLSCKRFSDSVHLSPECYKDLTKFIFKQIFERLPGF